jgi:hypothetical protein
MERCLGRINGNDDLDIDVYDGDDTAACIALGVFTT